MRSYFTMILLLILFVFSSNLSYGQPPPNCKKALSLIINTTNNYISTAQKAADSGNVLTGDLVKSVYHQNLAKKLFDENDYEKATQHSYRSRQLAINVIKVNKWIVPKDSGQTKEYFFRAKFSPDKRTLDKQIHIPAGINDKSVINIKQENVKVE